MNALRMMTLGAAMLAAACSSDPSPTSSDAGKDATSNADGASTTDAAGDGSVAPDGAISGPSTDATKPTPLTVGTPVSGTLVADTSTDSIPTPGSMHYFAFTVPTTGRYSLSLQGGIQAGHCPESKASGCLCQQGPVVTCCFGGTAGSCTYTCEKDKNVAWTQGTVIYPYAFNGGPGQRSYTLTITGPI